MTDHEALRAIAVATIPFAIVGGLSLGMFLGYISAAAVQGFVRKGKRHDHE